MFGYQSYDDGPASVQDQPDVEGADVSPTARAYWLSEPGSGEIRQVDLPDPGAGEVRVRTLVSGVSRGTEALVFRGGVPESQYDVMRAPFQEGELPGPVKYGYLNVGVVEAGVPRPARPHRLLPLPAPDGVRRAGRRGHAVVPGGVPPRRAVLAGTVETAVNALWDAAPLVGDRVAVVGAGMVGCCVARLLAGVPGVDVTLVDTDDRAEVAAALGVGFALPDDAPDDLDLVIHTSGTGAGLQLSLDLLGADGTVTDLSWYGDTPVELSLGGRFHSARLGIRASQVGEVAAARRGRRTPRRPAAPRPVAAHRPGVRRAADG